MQKIEFLALLRQRIAILPPREIEQTVEYYSEMIDDYIESGYTSEEAVAKMGGVDNVAAQVLAGEQTPAYDAYVVQKRKKNGLLWLVILGFPLWFPLLITAFCLVLTAAIALLTLAMVTPWSLVVSFGASAIALFAAAPAVLVGEGLAALALTVGAALILAALCILSTMAALHLSRLGGKGIGAMFKGFFKLLFGRR
ncbi:MAG: DUF1700 domain-containing protein [Ruminococcaceae bacterium]|nr:DUF1700 domain-containing protein [Oscillospiraceae bacterium]